jgi:hypothetical protein
MYRHDKCMTGTTRIYACGDRNFGHAWAIPVQADVGC